MPKYLVEFIGTFFLVATIGFAVVKPGAAAMAPVAIGSPVLAGAYAVGPISSAAFNPAVAVGITIMNLTPLASIWIYFVANLAAGACAGLAFKAIHPGEE